MSGLENYLKRQAELSEQRKKLKNAKASVTSKTVTEQSVIINQKLPLDKEKKRREKRSKNLPLELEITSQEVSHKSTVPPESEESHSGSNKIAFCTQDRNEDSGSEYFPSDGEIEESGGELITFGRIALGL